MRVEDYGKAVAAMSRENERLTKKVAELRAQLDNLGPSLVQADSHNLQLAGQLSDALMENKALREQLDEFLADHRLPGV
jgi:predicted nuclease with TOPRIM domain